MYFGIDAGNHTVKICGPRGLVKFPSDLGEYRERNLTNAHGRYDYVFEYQGRKGFAGTLAHHESEFAGSMLGETKAHQDCLIRVLLAVHQYTEMDCLQIVVGQPIGQHNPTEKEKIKNMICGRHSITVNGRIKTFWIERVEVAAEAGAAFWGAPRDGLVRVLDVGSGTINGATLQNKRYVDRDSFTLTFGANTNKSYDLEAMARAIATKAHKWGRSDTVLICGGIAESIVRYIQEYFPAAEILRPVWKGERVSPVYANAIGYYRIARGIYES